MAKKYEGDIVGWFYRNGHRIPIRGKSNKPDTYDGVPDKKPGRIIKSPEGQSEAKAKSRASVEEMRDWDLFGERGSYTTRKRPKPVTTKREPDKDKLRKKVNAHRASKYITEKQGPKNNKFYSTDYDTTGGHVHKDHNTVEEARDFLRRNNVLSPKKINKKRGK